MCPSIVSQLMSTTGSILCCKVSTVKLFVYVISHRGLVLTLIVS